MSSIYEDINAALKAVDENTFYGLAPRMNTWNYIVWNRDHLSDLSNRGGHPLYINVVIIRENFIPDETVQSVIAAMTALPGIKIEPDASFEYVKKTGTDTVAELLVLQFTKAVKRSE